ncbi:MAG: flagellar hook-basal body complex protein FliE [Burkholderiales bacterium]|jgi:flagellar hook-basal body complex protein FliE|nr:flagellar hook-basal body complex protein FliE [Burkholderiales bacterium]
MSTSGIDQMLRELRSAAAQAGAGTRDGADAAPAGGAPDFASMLRSSIDSVNAAQQDAQKVQRAFDADAPEANLQEVVVAMQKASLSFQTMVQVRNRLVTAYQDIMSTQV